uniref:Uncharacterized protein n=1 Tax=Arundo donax TaxID=35708 RepID=A0A0A8XYS4_ARUDO
MLQQCLRKSPLKPSGPGDLLVGSSAMIASFSL